MARFEQARTGSQCSGLSFVLAAGTVSTGGALGGFFVTLAADGGGGGGGGGGGSGDPSCEEGDGEERE